MKYLNSRISRPGTQYRVNTRIRDGELNMDNSTVEEETYGSVRDRIAGFNKESDIFDTPFPCQRKSCIFTNGAVDFSNISEKDWRK